MQKKTNQLWMAAFLLSAVFLVSPLKAQVTVGARTPSNSTLEVVKLPSGSATPDGIMAPQISGDDLKAKDGKYGANQNDVLVYVTAPVTVASTKTVNVKKAGYYYYDAAKGVWIAVASGNEDWFYMPSFNLPLDVTSYNLYDEYVRQFTKAGNTQFFSSDGTAATVTDAGPHPVSDITFFVTAYSANVIMVTGIDPDGTLHYLPTSDVVPDGSFINIIFKVK